MFGNVSGSTQYEEFLDFLGERILLKGWKNFRGGLDVKSGTTGTHSIHTVHDKYEIMFHVSTLLPFKPNDPQQLERKFVSQKKKSVMNFLLSFFLAGGILEMTSPSLFSKRETLLSDATQSSQSLFT